MTRKFLFKIMILCLAVLLAACNGKNKKYADLPPELAKLCKIIDKNPNNAEARYSRAVYYYNRGFIEEAKKDVFECLKLDDKNAKYYILMSDVYFAEKETDQTEEMLEHAISLEPENNEARLKLAELYFHLRMFKECNTTLDEALEHEKFNPKAHLIRGFCLKEMQDTIGAMRMFQLCIDQNPSEIRAFLELGYYYQGKLDPLAINYYQNALQVEPNNIEINFNLAKLLQDLGEQNKSDEQIEQAVEQYKIVLKLKEDHLPALNNLGYVYLVDQDKYEEALGMFDRALKVEPRCVEAYCNKGVAYECMGQLEKSREAYNAALKIAPNFEEAVLGLNRLDKFN
ncbi:MAG: tetratricopeptide repeat protein [Bacteroidales bacterium]|nr:tetratricopeptide repeat protein [Bacteroidales bacterium]